MTFNEAFPKMMHYVEERKAIRKAVLTELRNRVENGQGNFATSERRKLFNYPTDLTDQRLLDMLTKTEAK